MIHSLAGGNLGNVTYHDFAKVKILEGNFTGAIIWFLADNLNLKEGKIVVVPIQNEKVKAEILRIDKNVSSQSSPISVKHAKKIIKQL